MSEEKKPFDGDESYEDIFRSLREKYHLNEDSAEEESVSTFYDPDEDTEIEEFFTRRNEECSETAEEFMDPYEDDEAEEETESRDKNSEPSPEDYEWDENTVLDFGEKNGGINEKTENIPMTFEDISSDTPAQEKDEGGISLEKIKEEQTIRIDASDEVSQGNGEDNFSISENAEDENPEFEFEDEEYEYSQENSGHEISSEYFEDEEEQTSMKDVTYESIVWEDFPDGKEKHKKKKKKKSKHGIFPRKGDSAGEVIRKIVLIISVLAIIASGGWLINDLVIQPYLAGKNSEQLGQSLLNTKTNKVVSSYEDLDEEDRALTMSELIARNPEYMGWLTVSGGDVSLPVVKASNNDKYLHRDFDGNYLYAGTLFVDCRNTSLYDKNVIIYGHNMSNGTMFGSLGRYKTSEGTIYKSNPLIYFHTINGDFVYKIFAVYLADGSFDNDNGFISNALVTNYTNDAFMNYMDAAAQKRYYDTGVDYREDDSIITLVTCDRSNWKDGRQIMVGRMVRAGESY